MSSSTVISRRSRETRPWKNLLRWTSLLVLAAAGVAASIWGYDYARKLEFSQLKSTFQGIANTRAQNIENYLNLLLDVAHGASTYVQNTETIKASDFKQYANDVFSRHRSFRSMGWIPLLDHDARMQMELPDVAGGFVIKHLNEEGKLERLPTKDSYFPLVTLEVSPYYGITKPEKDLMGFDFSTDSTWILAMREAQSKGKITISMKGTSNKNLFVFSPVYKKGSPYETKSQRLKNLRGYLIAAIQVADLVETGAHQAGAITENATTKLYSLSKRKTRKLLYPYARGTGVGKTEIAQLITKVRSSAEFGSASQYWLVESEPTAEFFEGRDIYTPWAILISGSFLTFVIVAYLFMLMTRNAQIERQIRQRSLELEQAHDKIRESELMLMQSDKMSSLGQMVAGVAHEINTPLGFVKSSIEMLTDSIKLMGQTFVDSSELLHAVNDLKEGELDLNNLQILIAAQMEKIDAILQEDIIVDAFDNVQESLKGLSRISEIVSTLKDFSRIDRAMSDQVDIHECIDSTLVIAHNDIKNHAEIIKEYGNIPHITCAPSKINQVLLNLVSNAAQAMDDDFGKIYIRTRAPDADHIEIEIEDTGKGIPIEVQQKVFEPFFTTKDVGKGTGLGLSISHKIIMEHQGDIRVDSTPGEGTRFTILLPVHQKVEKQQSGSEYHNQAEEALAAAS